MSTPPVRPTQEQLDRYAERFNQSNTLRHFGVRVSFPALDLVRVDLDPVQPEQRGGLGSDAVNGGVLAAMFDLAIGCTPALIDPTRRNATIQLSMTFMRAVKGNRLHAEGRIRRPGSTTLFSSASIYDEQGVECARCEGVVRVSRVTWASGESPAVN